MTCANLYMIGIPEGEETEKRIKKCICRNYDWKLPKSKEGSTKYPGTGSTELPPNINLNKSIRHVVIKMTKVR